MTDSVYELMKASAAEAIPQHRRALTAFEAQILAAVLAQLRASLNGASERTLAFLAALEARRGDWGDLLSELETEEIVMLHEGLQHCWDRIGPAPQQRALRHLYQLVAAHFFVYHVQA